MAGKKTQGFAQWIYKQSAEQKERLGTIRELEDGRVFAYARAGDTALAAAKLTASAAPSANANNEALSASQSAAIGDMSVTVTFGGAVTADFYKDGWFWVNDATGEGHIYQIKSHPAGTTDVVVQLYDPIRVALVASTSEWSAVANRQNLVVVHPTTIAAPAAGVPLIAVTEYYYFWNQVKGPAPCLFHTGTDGAATIGECVTPATTNSAAAGAVESTDKDDYGPPTVGTVASVNATTEYGLVLLQIPGY